MENKVKRIRKARVAKIKDRRIINPLTPQQERFILNYTDTKSDTFGNCLQSGIKAGFSPSYSKDIMYLNMDWVSKISERLGDEKRLKKAEENFNEYQNLDITNGGDKVDIGILNAKIKVDTWLGERLNKAKYSTRTENATIIKHVHEIDEETKARLDNLLS